MLKRFILKLLLYSTPFLCIFTFVLLTGFYFGEILPYTIVLQFQSNNPTSFFQNRSTRLEQIQYKLVAASIQHPDIMVMGSSRVIGTSSGIFNQQDSHFYNFGFPAGQIGEIYQVLQILEVEKSLPDVLILGLDLPDFNADRRNFRTGMIRNIHMPSLFETVSRLKEDFYSISQKWVATPYETYVQLITLATLDPQPIGLTALEAQLGDRYDGSRFRMIREDTSEARIQGFSDFLANRELMFEVGYSVNPEALMLLDTILNLAQANNMIVVGYWPPFYSTIYDELMQSSDFAYIPLAKAEVTAVFAAYDAPLFDFSVATVVGGSDNEMRDGWHSSELLDARIYAAMYHAYPDIFMPYINIDELEMLIESTNSSYYLFD